MGRRRTRARAVAVQIGNGPRSISGFVVLRQRTLGRRADMGKHLPRGGGGITRGESLEDALVFGRGLAACACPAFMNNRNRCTGPLSATKALSRIGLSACAAIKLWKRASELARRLSAHPAVTKVHYPGLPRAPTRSPPTTAPSSARCPIRRRGSTPVDFRPRGDAGADGRKW